jgi:hypothetical protein
MQGVLSGPRANFAPCIALHLYVRDWGGLMTQ